MTYTLTEGFVWTVSDDIFQQKMLRKSIELVRKNCNMPTCVITSDKNLRIDVDKLIYIEREDSHPKFDFFTRLKHCPWDIINYLSNRTMVIKPLSNFITNKHAQFLIRPNLIKPNFPVYKTVNNSWFVDNSWFRISKFHVIPLEYGFTGGKYSDVEQPLTQWVQMLTNRTLHTDLWFPSSYRDMLEIKKLYKEPLSEDWLGLPKVFFEEKPIFEIAEQEHFDQFLKEKPNV